MAGWTHTHTHALYFTMIEVYNFSRLFATMAAWNESLNEKKWKKTSFEETEACNKSCLRNKEILLLFNIVTVFFKVVVV